MLLVRVLTHQSKGQPFVSICRPSFSGVSFTVGASHLFLWQIPHIESASELAKSITEKIHSDWQYNSWHRDRNGSEESKQRLKLKGHEIVTCYIRYNYCFNH